MPNGRKSQAQWAHPSGNCEAARSLFYYLQCLGLVDGKITQDSLWATSERKYRTWYWKRWVTQSWKMDFPFFISTDPTQSVYFISCCVPVNKNCKVTHDSLRATDSILKNQIFFFSSHQPSLCQSSLCLQCLGLVGSLALPAALVFSKLHFVKQ